VVVQEAYVHGISTGKVDDLVKALGMAGLSKSQVSRLCEELDEKIARFRDRPLDGPYLYVWIDATYVKARWDGRVTWVAGGDRFRGQRKNRRAGGVKPRRET
jgi:putative transposase